MFKNPFSFDGRIRRLEYGLSYILYLVIYLPIYYVSFFAYPSPLTIIPFVLFMIPLSWFMWAQGAKRCHDRGNSGWWQLIPFYGFWMLFADGEIGDNEYGENPKGLSYDFGDVDKDGIISDIK